MDSRPAPPRRATQPSAPAATSCHRRGSDLRGQLELGLCLRGACGRLGGSSDRSPQALGACFEGACVALERVRRVIRPFSVGAWSVLWLCLHGACFVPDRASAGAAPGTWAPGDPWRIVGEHRSAERRGRVLHGTPSAAMCPPPRCKRVLPYTILTRQVVEVKHGCSQPALRDVADGVPLRHELESSSAGAAPMDSSRP